MIFVKREYKKILTKNGNEYIGWIINERGDYQTTFGWVLNKEDIKKVIDL